MNHETGKQIAAELSLVGYAEPVPGKRETYRNTPAGNKVAGARHPRLTRKTAEEILADVADRAEKLNLDRDRPVSVEKIVAFGGITTLHARIQDVELGVYLAQKLGRTATDADRRVVLKLLKGRSAALKLYPLEGWLLRRPGRVVWEK